MAEMEAIRREAEEEAKNAPNPKEVENQAITAALSSLQREIKQVRVYNQNNFITEFHLPRSLPTATACTTPFVTNFLWQERPIWLQCVPIVLHRSIHV
jgi:hypothetical protein